MVAVVSYAIGLFIVPPVGAQEIPAGADPGRVEQRFEVRQPTEVTPRVARGLESTMPPAEAAALKLILSSVSVVGSTVYTQDEIDQLSQHLVGQQVTLAEVFGIAAAITERYGSDGYILSRAIVPPQELDPSGASIRIEILEGYVDEVRWPEVAEKYHDLFSSYSAKIVADRPLNVRTLERYLLLANDLPGLNFQSNLVASETQALASTLIITGTEDKFSGFVSIDNHGVEASGPYQATAGVTFSNWFRDHSQFEFFATIAGPSEDDGEELLYLDWRFEKIITSEGLRFFVDGNANWGEPGTAPLIVFSTETSGFNISTGLAYPFIRSREQNLTGTVAFDFKNSESSNLGAPATEDRLRILRGELAYDLADEHGGVNRIVASAHVGIDGLGSTANGNPLASRTPGVVDFFRVTGELSRNQKLHDRWSLYGSIFGQWSADPLLSSQECGYGGRSYGRGFDSFIVTGDHCFLGLVELRRDVRVPKAFSQFLTYAQPYAFADYGHIWNIDAPVGTPRTDEGASIGLGVRFGGEKLSAELSAAHVVVTPDSQPNVSDTTGWFKATIRF